MRQEEQMFGLVEECGTNMCTTCKKRSINPQKWHDHVIRNISDTKTSKLKFLLPQFIDKI